MSTINEKLGCSIVGIAGLGGLGSNIAAALARSGIGKLIICDFDKVEESNLNRQYFFIDQLGRFKVDCMIENLCRINPQAKIEGHKIKLDSENIPKIFAGADCIAECFDSVPAKQMIVETVLSKMNCMIVSASGLAGYGKSNEIQTRRVGKRLIIAGDGQRSTDTCKTLTAARIGIVAMHQANAIIELLVDEIKKEVV